jgi:glycosyltransferase involved in cell wall biosynthesis
VKRERLVAINARAASRAQIGGVERLAREMVRWLPRLNPQRYRVIAPPSVLAHRAGHAWEQLALPVLSAECALVYSPANLAPLLSARNVVVIHDVASLRHPQAYTRQYAAYQRVMLNGLVRRARRLITVSEFSKRELVEVLGAAPERIAVVPEGVAEDFGQLASTRPATGAYGLTGPYVLVVGTASERKNLGVLGAASRRLRERGVELVLAGSDRGYLRVGDIPLRRLGYVAEEHLPAVYADAVAVAMPSVYEGFGLPCLEAMACGTPVVAAASGALPETVGDAALLVAPHDADAFAEALLSVAFEEDTRAPLIEAGRRRAAHFTWTRTAMLTDHVIEEVLGDDRSGRA